MNLRRGESILLYAGASLHQGLPGWLYVTNHRVVFEVAGPTPWTAYEQGIDGVSNVHTGAIPASKGVQELLTIEGARGRYIFEVKGARAWANAIINANSNSTLPPPPYIPPPPPGHVPPGQVVINVPVQPPPKVMMHCRNCGSLYDATNGRCDKCGAPPT
jgi:hypothetical protein